MSGGSRPVIGRRTTSAFPNRPNCRNVVVGVMVILTISLLSLLWSQHLSADASATSVLMDKISKLEASLLQHNQAEHGALNKDFQENEGDVERLKGVVAVGDGALKKSVSDLDNTMVRLQDRIRELESGMVRHETHHREHVDPNMHNHDGNLNELAGASPGGAESVAQLQDKIRALEAGMRDHAEHHRTNVDPHMHTHTDGNGNGNGNNKALPAPAAAQPQLRGSSSSSSSVTSGDTAASLGASLGQDTVLLVIASHRYQYLTRSLGKVVAHHPALQGVIPIVVSEDGEGSKMRTVVNEARTKLAQRGDGKSTFVHINHHSTPGERGPNGYFALSAHFKWALTQVFEHSSEIGLPVSPKRVIILEEDLEIAPDFFSFFASVAPLVDNDPTVLAASAWNDNGQERNVRDNRQLYRSDFFPGLGWMMAEHIWAELKLKWPKAYWDDWLREPQHRQGRHTLRPEVCRSLHFGVRGVSNSQYQSDWMTDIRLNDVPIDFSQEDVSYLQADRWDQYYIEGRVKKAHLSTTGMLDQDRIRDKTSHRAATGESSSSSSAVAVVPASEYRVEYEGNAGFERLAKWAQCMDNIKANVPRTAYKGVVTIWFGDARLHLVPKDLK